MFYPKVGHILGKLFICFNEYILHVKIWKKKKVDKKYLEGETAHVVPFLEHVSSNSVLPANQKTGSFWILRRYCIRLSILNPDPYGGHDSVAPIVVILKWVTNIKN